MVPPPGEVTSGRILFNGQNIAELGDAEMRAIRGRQISVIFQDPTTSLNPVFSCGQQIVKVINQHTAFRRAQARSRAMQLLEEVGLPDPKAMFNAYPHQLSGGMQQRIMIAIALAANPQLLIADEPTTALDVTIQAQILDLLKSLQKDRGLAILFITHNLGVVAEMCNGVGVLYAGRLVEEGLVGEFFHSPHHPYSHGLLAALPKLTDRASSLQSIPGNVPSGQELLQGCAFAPRCPHTMRRCQENTPPLHEISAYHRSACFLAEPEQ
jgi:oligopeptide/dipeptide ABC transporter ATP-binding protein